MARAPRSLDDPLVRRQLAEQNGAMHRRNLAAVEYITDPDKRSIEWHWINKWSARGVNSRLFESWSAVDKWVSRRVQFWAEIERRIFEARAESIVVARLHELERLTETRGFLDEYLYPLRDNKGKVRRHPDDHDFAGLPIFPLKLPTLDRFVKAYLDLDERIMMKRGEVKTLRDPDVAEPSLAAPESALTDPAASSASFSSDELRAMARVLVRARQPELAAQPEVGILVEGVTAEEQRDEAENHGGDPSRHVGRIQSDDRGGKPGSE